MADPQRREFAIHGCLGRGGFGEVYLATMTGAGGIEADVAVKILRSDLDPRGQAIRRLRDEGKLLARLNHPTILRVHDLVCLDGRISLVTEFVDGEDLATIFQHGAMPARPLVEALGQVAGALAAAWNAPVPDRDEPLRLVHRDVKPSNIRIGRHGEVKLLDFGIARADSVTREARTQTDMLVGSPAYMAPERYLDNRLDPACDVFAVGSTLFEGLAGRRFSGDLPVTMLATLAIDPDRYEVFRDRQLEAVAEGTVDPDVEALLRDLLAFDPSARPTAEELAVRCEHLADGLKGPSLNRWCLSRTWVPAAVTSGPMEGRTLLEETLPELRNRSLSAPPSTAPAPVPVPSPRPRRALLATAVGAFGLASIAAAALAAGGVGIGVWQWTTQDPLDAPPSDPAPPDARGPEAPPAEVPPEVAPPAAEAPPEADPPAEADPRPDPEPPDMPRPTPLPADPPPSRPAPAPPPAAPPDPAPARVMVRYEGQGVVASIVGSAGTWPLPAEVPPGRYVVHAIFRKGEPARTDWEIDVTAGGDHLVTCEYNMFSCKVH